MMTTVIDQQHPNAVAERLTGRDYISYSALSTYASCPLRYYFKYVEGLPEETVSSSLVFGGALHSSVEFHFNELMAGNPAPDQDALLGVFWDAWRDRNEEAVINFGKGEDVTTITQLADRVLTAFRQSDLAEPHGRILGVEEQLRGELVPDVPDLLARIDLIVETDEELVITDFKTSKWQQIYQLCNEIVTVAECQISTHKKGCGDNQWQMPDFGCDMHSEEETEQQSKHATTAKAQGSSKCIGAFVPFTTHDRSKKCRRAVAGLVAR